MSKQQQLDLLNAEVALCNAYILQKDQYIVDLNAAITQTEAQIVTFNSSVTQANTDKASIQANITLFNEIITIIGATSGNNN